MTDNENQIKAIDMIMEAADILGWTVKLSNLQQVDFIVIGDKEVLKTVKITVDNSEQKG